jgi:hypothetical protein
MQTRSFPFAKTFLITILFSFCFSSCQVMLTGAYDQVTDQSFNKIQDDVSTLIVRLERNLDSGNPENNAYPVFMPAYESLAGQIQSLRMRCSAIPKYNIVLGHVEALSNTVNDLEKFHKLGIPNRESLIVIRRTFEIEFKAVVQLQNALKRKKTDK